MKFVKNQKGEISLRWMMLFGGVFVVCAIVLVFRYAGKGSYLSYNELQPVQGQFVVVNQADLKRVHNQLEERLTATEQHLKKMEENLVKQTETAKVSMAQLGHKIDEVEQREKNIEKNVIDKTIKREVSDQFVSLREESQQREREKRRKRLLNSFLDQLAESESEKK